jgi:hypothetical protein
MNLPNYEELIRPFVVEMADFSYCGSCGMVIPPRERVIEGDIYIDKDMLKEIVLKKGFILVQKYAKLALKCISSLA